MNGMRDWLAGFAIAGATISVLLVVGWVVKFWWDVIWSWLE